MMLLLPYELLPYMLVDIGQTKFSLFVDLMMTVVPYIASSNSIGQLQVRGMEINVGMDVEA